MLKKVVITIAAVLVMLIPTYVLVFQAVRTASPEVTVGGVAAEPAFVRWSVVNSDGETVVTSQNEKQLQKRFERAKPFTLGRASELSMIDFGRDYDKATLTFYSLETEDAPYSVAYSDFNLTSLPAFGKTQAILTVQWKLTGGIVIQAAYSFEVNLI